jgi:hypothetical protein
MAAVAFFLVALIAGDTPSLATLAMFQSADACHQAESSIATALKSGGMQAKVVCLTTSDLSKLAGAGK